MMGAWTERPRGQLPSLGRRPPSSRRKRPSRGRRAPSSTHWSLMGFHIFPFVLHVTPLLWTDVPPSTQEANTAGASHARRGKSSGENTWTAVPPRGSGRKSRIVGTQAVHNLTLATAISAHLYSNVEECTDSSEREIGDSYEREIRAVGVILFPTVAS